MIFAAVQEAVAGALGVDDDEATPEATLMDDLGAESIDLLDILFRIERSGVKIQASDLGDDIQGGIPDEEFGAGEAMSRQGPRAPEDGDAADRRGRVPASSGPKK